MRFSCVRCTHRAYRRPPDTFGADRNVEACVTIVARRFTGMITLAFESDASQQ
jgi:hypothetical protein